MLVDLVSRGGNLLLNIGPSGIEFFYGVLGFRVQGLGLTFTIVVDALRAQAMAAFR